MGKNWKDKMRIELLLGLAVLKEYQEIRRVYKLK